MPICPEDFDDCRAPAECARLCRRMLLAPVSALHFVGFRDERYHAAVRAFGPPDFYHRRWDARARAEIVPGDVAVFAVGDETAEVDPYG